MTPSRLWRAPRGKGKEGGSQQTSAACAYRMWCRARGGVGDGTRVRPALYRATPARTIRSGLIIGSADRSPVCAHYSTCDVYYIFVCVCVCVYVRVFFRRGRCRTFITKETCWDCTFQGYRSCPWVTVSEKRRERERERERRLRCR